MYWFNVCKFCVNKELTSNKKTGYAKEFLSTVLVTEKGVEFSAL